ncbi:MAG: hypothetical protein OEU46_19005 [Alphaproteobacteria bacterium]|nr:hypothetical protein [Alphaproteobacteria bacterium]
MRLPKYSFGIRGIRSGQWSQSKWTNTSKFDPGQIEIEKVISRFYNKIYNSAGITVIVLPTNPNFINPLNEENILKTLSTVPKNYTAGLAGILVLGGSKKQEKTFNSLFSYGRYRQDTIIIHPFPKRYLEQRFKTLPKPNVMNEYERAGAKVTRRGKHWYVRFDEDSLEQFYLRDVLLHELGHHVDSENFRSKPLKKAERFADWFASEHGFKLWDAKGR